MVRNASLVLIRLADSIRCMVIDVCSLSVLCSASPGDASYVEQECGLNRS